MELREYLRIILKSWWLILPVTLLSLTVALSFSYLQTPIYEASSKYITGLSAGVGTDPGQFIYAFDTLAGRDRLFNTYCELMKSDSAWNRAQQLLGFDPAAPPVDLRLYTRNCTNLPQSNVLQLIVQGPSPQLVRDLNYALGLVGISKANELYPFFPLAALDAVYLEPIPVSPSHSRDAILGLAIGIVISVTIALLLDNLRSPLERLESQSIRDPLLNTFNDRYFQQRLTEEVNRARIRYRPLSMVFSRLVPNEDFALLPEGVRHALQRSAALYMQNMLREGDLLAYNRKQDYYELLLPETPNHEAKELVTKIHTEIRNQTFRIEQYVSNFTLSSGVVEGSGETLELQTMVQQAAKALEKARSTGENTIVFMRGAPSPFVLDDSTDMDGTTIRADMNEYLQVPVPAVTASTALDTRDATKESRGKAASGGAFVGWDMEDDPGAYDRDYISDWMRDPASDVSNGGGSDLSKMIADLQPMDDSDTNKDKPKGESDSNG